MRVKKELRIPSPSAHLRDGATIAYRVRPLELADFPLVGQRLEEFLGPDAVIDTERMNADLGSSLEPSEKCTYWIIELEHDHDAVALAVGAPRSSAPSDMEAVVWLIGTPSIDSGLIQASKSVQKILHWAPFDFCRAKGWSVARIDTIGGAVLSETKICALKSKVP